MKKECIYLFNDFPNFPLNKVMEELDDEADRICECLSDSKLSNDKKLFKVGKICGRVKSDIYNVLRTEHERSAMVESNNEHEYNAISWAVKQVLKEIGNSGDTIKTADAIGICNKYIKMVMENDSKTVDE